MSDPNDKFAKELARHINEHMGEFMLEDQHGDYNETEVSRVWQVGKYINVDLDNGQRFKIVVEPA